MTQCQSFCGPRNSNSNSLSTVGLLAPGAPLACRMAIWQRAVAHVAHDAYDTDTVMTHVT